MKRMNEVFELPIYYADAVSFTVNLTRSETESITHAINNVDALADALETLLPHVESNRELGKSGESAHAAAQIVLNAYRGAK